MIAGPSSDSRQHKWQRDLWTSGYEAFAKPGVSSRLSLIPPNAVPLDGCLKCGAIRVVRLDYPGTGERGPARG